MQLYEHQKEVLEKIKGRKRVLLSLDMGLGKSLVASEHLKTLDYEICLIVCPKSLIGMWQEHFKKFYNQEINDFTKTKKIVKGINIVNYDLVFRRKELLNIPHVTLILDECVAISNDKAKRTKAIMKMDAENVILISGSISKGKYENLYTLAKMLGALCTKKQFYERYIVEKELKINGQPFPIKIIVGYKNQEELRANMIKRGTVFMKTEDVLNLPMQNFIDIEIEDSKEYRKFKKDFIVTVDNKELVGDCTLSKMLYERQLCSCYSKAKLDTLRDLINSTDDRLIIFYNFWEEYNKIVDIIGDRPLSVVNGKERDLSNYDNISNSITLINYSAGSSGLNLQKANKIIYFSLPVSCEFWMQSAKRIHRINQDKPCFYYILKVKDSIDYKIHKALLKGQDYVNFLYEKGI